MAPKEVKEEAMINTKTKLFQKQKEIGPISHFLINVETVNLKVVNDQETVMRLRTHNFSVNVISFEDETPLDSSNRSNMDLNIKV